MLNYDYIMNEFNAFEDIIPESTLKKEKEKWKNIPRYDLNQISDFIKENEQITDKLFLDMYNIDPVISKTLEKKNDTIQVKLTSNR